MSTIQQLLFVKLLSFLLVCAGREERQAAIWSCSSELFVFRQHVVTSFIFVSSVVFTFGLLGIMGNYFWFLFWHYFDDFRYTEVILGLFSSFFFYPISVQNNNPTRIPILNLQTACHHHRSKSHYYLFIYLYIVIYNKRCNNRPPVGDC